MIDAGGADIRNFSYKDRAPWPESADGQGSSMVLIAPQSAPDHGVALNWRSSALPGGAPGESDALAFDGEAGADNDGDGMSAFLEYALGSSDLIAGGSQVAVINEQPGQLLIGFSRRLAADDAIVSVEVSSDLVTWVPAGDDWEIESVVPAGNGTELITLRIPGDASKALFIRLSVTPRL